MQEYYVLNMAEQARDVLTWVFQRGLPYEVHLNRTRFWVPSGAVNTEFHLRFADACPRVDSIQH
jgi:hypothetical protein